MYVCGNRDAVIDGVTVQVRPGIRQRIRCSCAYQYELIVANSYEQRSINNQTDRGVWCCYNEIKKKEIAGRLQENKQGVTCKD